MDGNTIGLAPLVQAVQLKWGRGSKYFSRRLAAAPVGAPVGVHPAALLLTTRQDAIRKPTESADWLIASHRGWACACRAFSMKLKLCMHPPSLLLDAGHEDSTPVPHQSMTSLHVPGGT